MGRCGGRNRGESGAPAEAGFLVRNFNMPSRYVIHTKPVPHRFEPVTKSGIIAWEEGCLKCAVCVKKQCVYGVYENRALDSRQMIDSIDNQCMNCLRCVQGCPKELIHKSLNPEFKAVGDSYWSPEIIARLWYQAETGKIPVSGSGYPGPFSGPGFDSMWTDMSEIVRPTRDGIHGREYISTAIDIGRTPPYLKFTGSGDLDGESLSVVDIPLPIILKVPGFGSLSDETIKGWSMAARRLGTLMSIPEGRINDAVKDFGEWLMPVISPDGPGPGSAPEGVRLVEVPWSDDWKGVVRKIEEKDPSLLISVKIPVAVGMEEKALLLVEEGISIIHLEAGPDGRFLDDQTQYIKDGIRSVHTKLIGEGVRDELTLLASGGLAMAEHVAKAMICGADSVFVDFPILIALECRMCRRCTKGLSCPVEIDAAPSTWVAARVVNLLGAWHNQLLEVMGAMGIMDARRLRGETGRAMFFEELDRSLFGPMGKVEEGCELE
jgi:ferredoxin